MADARHLLDSLTPVDDAAFAAAYEAVPDVRRARLKEQVARLCAVCDAPDHLATPAEEGRSLAWPGGARTLQHSRPAPLAVVALGPGFTAPSRLLAALVPARLAGVEELVVVGPDAAPFTDGLLVAMELAGVDQALSAAPKTLDQTLEKLTADLHVTQARLVCLERPAPTHVHGVWAAPQPPRLGLVRPEVFDAEALAFCHGSAPESLAGLDQAEGCDAVFAPRELLGGAPGQWPSADALAGNGPRLLFTEGYESAWDWPGLGPAFFRSVRRAYV